MSLGTYFWAGWVAVLGLGIGSFINVVVDRLQAGESLHGRSYCPHCRHRLPWYCLIPVVSYVALRAHCHFCRRPIALQYPVVEVSAGALFALAALWFIADPWRLAWHLAMFSILLMIFLYDLKYYMIPDVFSLTGLVLAVIGQIVFGTAWWSIGLGMGVGASIFLIQYLVSRGRWIGGGDVRLGVLLGAYLAWPLTLVGLFFAYIFGAVAALFLLARHQKQFGDKLPFGTALAVATVFTVFFGQDILWWYLYGIFR